MIWKKKKKTIPTKRVGIIVGMGGKKNLKKKYTLIPR